MRLCSLPAGGQCCGLLQPGSRLKDLQGAENQEIAADVIRTGRTQANPAKLPACAIANVFTSKLSLRLLLFSGRPIFVQNVPLSEPSTVQFFR
jgi:hypothetical protein